MTLQISGLQRHVTASYLTRARFASQQSSMEQLVEAINQHNSTVNREAAVLAVLQRDESLWLKTFDCEGIGKALKINPPRRDDRPHDANMLQIAIEKDMPQVVKFLLRTRQRDQMLTQNTVTAFLNWAKGRDTITRDILQTLSIVSLKTAFEEGEPGRESIYRVQHKGYEFTFVQTAVFHGAAPVVEAMALQGVRLQPVEVNGLNSIFSLIEANIAQLSGGPELAEARRDYLESRLQLLERLRP